MDYDIFISYSQRVPEPTIALADELTRRGFRPWYDVNLLPGQYFGKVIDAAIDRAKAVVTIWSPPALTSTWVPAESARALEQNKLICFRTEDVDPQKLPTPFHQMHMPIWTDFDSLVQALIDKGVRPDGTSGLITDLEALMQAAQTTWRVTPMGDTETLKAFLQLYGQFAMFRVMARKRLEALLATGAPSLRPTPLPEPPPVKPEDVILRLDPGMHTAKIGRSIGVSTDGRLLATASHDKTVKLWALPEGKLLRILRPRIGPGAEGKVYAMALDPSGRWVAAGGWMSKTGLEDFVTLFDTATGAVRVRLGPLPHRVKDIAVSPDGSRLAAGLGGSNGVRVWDTARSFEGDARPVFEDLEFSGDVYGLAFGPTDTPAAGRLAASSQDGHVRLYAPSGERLAKAKAPGGEPYGVAFSPDGRILAVGYNDALQVDLLDAGTMCAIGSADVKGLSGGNLISVAFLNPAKPGAAPRLVAGGMHKIGGCCPIFVWADAGRGTRTAWRGPKNTITDLAPLTDGSLAFSAADPAFGLIDAAGRRTLFRGPVTADLRNKVREHFTVSADGRRLRFGLKQRSGSPVLFDLATRRMTDAPQPLSDLVPANTDRLRIEGWENTTSPTLDGKPLPLKTYEGARSLAIAPDAQSFALGADWNLGRFDAQGASLWKKPVPGTVWGVNLACEGRLILAAYGDCTIRWHRAEDGAELLALFIHLPQGPDGPREWILFTPEGYYDASSPEAEKLIGWHLNRGPDEAADFYPVDTFASVYKKPDRIAAALASV